MGCNVFLCYRRGTLEDSDEPIRDQALACDLYHTLTAHGINTFFSEKDLSDPAASYSIYKALHEAQILIVVGTSRENLESERTFSEWRRFRNTILNGEKPDAEIFTYLEGMTADELPFALSDTETFDPQHKAYLVDCVKEDIGLTARTIQENSFGQAASDNEEAWPFDDTASPFAPDFAPLSDSSDMMTFDDGNSPFASDENNNPLKNADVYFFPEAQDASADETEESSRKRKLALSIAAVLLALSSLLAVFAAVTSSGRGAAAPETVSSAVSSAIAHKGYRGSDTLRAAAALTAKDEVKRGDHLRFGTYEQDGDLTNGTEYIEWRVIAVEEGHALLLTEYLLTHQRYDGSETYKSATWEDCTLRQWLNESFFNDAFSSEEQDMIATATLTNSDSAETEGWNDTQDQVFALSRDDVRKYLASNDNAKALVTDAAYNSEWDNKERYGNWWLRSVGGQNGNTMYVKYNGSVNSFGKVSLSQSIAVRPALWIELP